MLESRVKREPKEWDKIFANDEGDKSLNSKIYKQLIQLNKKKKLKMVRRPTFPPKSHTDGKQAHENIFDIVNY